MPPQAPPLPRRPGQPPPEDPLPDEPPPPYEPTPALNQEQTLEYGPLRPFQPPPRPAPHQHPHHSGPAGSGSSSSSWAPPPQPSPASPGPSLPPPSFPFWNGASLTPAQTGFSEGNLYSQPFTSGPPQLPVPGAPVSPQHTSAYSPPPHAPPFPSTSPRPSEGPPGGGGGPRGYEPTETPTPGQPLLNQGRLLVYPSGKEPCWKCQGSGYKPFDPFTGYVGDDPSHPCRKCWQKYGRPYTSALRVSLQNPTSPVPPNYQRPLRLVQTPQTRPAPPQVVMAGRYMPVQPGALVVRPGDPRMGGVLCRRCGGDGLVAGFLLIDDVTCEVCNGVGRVFI
ncbi:hypothetical protein DMC30DRAFT_445004 [Rhodotorula diobovata]|uniref:Proline-rich protein n=1 Tax=Rhodotorula diobovata TaxID=5288 RepID=A0A5C5G2V9_9BASI|nr:hypothetical protein DMC30DRAFT_445004 [Rhodotorula diobovata]